MPKVLLLDVHVPVRPGQVHTLRAGDVVPEEFEDRITNPSAFRSIETETPEPIEVTTPTGAPVVITDYRDLDRPALVALAVERGVGGQGKSPEIIERLVAADAANAAPAAPEAEPVAEEVGDPDLDTLDEAALRALANTRGVDVSDATSTEEIIALLENAQGE